MGQVFTRSRDNPFDALDAARGSGWLRGHYR